MVAIGRLLGETSAVRERKEVDLVATAPDGTELVGRIDWADLRQRVLHETKQSRAVEDARRWQLKFYLWLLRLPSAPTLSARRRRSRSLTLLSAWNMLAVRPERPWQSPLLALLMYVEAS